MKAAVFIERDGILNETRVGGGRQMGPVTLQEYRPNREVLPLLYELKAAGLALFATTNQPGLSTGQQSRRELDAMHRLLGSVFPLDDILVCPHGEGDHCACRKPRPGLLIEAARARGLNLKRSFVVSDKWQDAEMAWGAGCTSILVNSPWLGIGHHDLVMPDLASVVEKILGLWQPKAGDASWLSGELAAA